MEGTIIPVALYHPLGLLLGGKAIKVLKDYIRQKRAGKNPVYRWDEVQIGDRTVWDEAHARKWEEG